MGLQGLWLHLQSSKSDQANSDAGVVFLSVSTQPRAKIVVANEIEQCTLTLHIFPFLLGDHNT